jgi:hypothetical protein
MLRVSLVLIAFTLIIQKRKSDSLTFELTQVEVTLNTPTKKILRHLTINDTIGKASLVYGNTTYLKYYYTNIYIGNPPQKQAVLIDTGSQISSVPCMPYCKECGKHINSYYDLRNSTTCRLLDCNSKFCNYGCDKEKKCPFSIVSVNK